MKEKIHSIVPIAAIIAFVLPAFSRIADSFCFNCYKHISVTAINNEFREWLFVCILVPCYFVLTIISVDSPVDNVLRCLQLFQIATKAFSRKDLSRAVSLPH